MTTIDQIIAEKISALYVNEWPIGNMLLCIIAMVLSVILCGAIGIERERKGRNAGLRTHLLVGVGSCLIMIISIYGFPLFLHTDEGFKRDVARLAAAVVTGVGFLGAGAIIHRNAGIKGLTTAATIWIVMAIGLACGSMNFVLATGSTILILVVLVIFKGFESRFNKKAPLVRIIASGGTPVMSKLLEICEKFDCKANEVAVDLLDNKDVEISFYAVAMSTTFDVNNMVAEIEKLDGVANVGLANIRR